MTTSVDITGEPVLTGVGQRSQFTATATLSDGSTQNVTRQTTVWQSSNQSVAVISLSGVVTTVKDGTTTLIATYQGVTGSFTLAVASVTTTFQGVASGSNGQRGTFTVNIQGAVGSVSAPTSARVSGSMQFAGGAPIVLSGFYEPYTNVVSVSGFADGQFAFSGSVVNGILSGTYTAPGGVTGTFMSQTSTVR